MKKLIVSFLLVFSFLAVRDATVYAWPDFDFPDFPDFSWPTSTPTPTLPLFKFNPGIVFPLGSDSPTPTATPTNTPTVTPTPTTEPTAEPTKKEEAGTTTTKTVSPTVKTESSSAKASEDKEKKSLSQKDMVYGGTIGGLSLVVLYQAWPWIKKLLHDKTA